MAKLYFRCANCDKAIEDFWSETPIELYKGLMGLTLCRECGWGEDENGHPEMNGHAHIEHYVFRGGPVSTALFIPMKKER